MKGKCLTIQGPKFLKQLKTDKVCIGNEDYRGVTAPEQPLFSRSCEF